MHIFSRIFRGIYALKYLAHIAEDGREQTVLEHLQGTAELCADFASAFHAEEQGRMVGMMHDIGKYSNGFQQRLHGGPKVDHSTAGSFELIRSAQENVPAAFCVAGHHGGLPDGGSQGDIEGSTLLGRMAAAQSGKLPPYDAWKQEQPIPHGQLPAYCQGGRDALASAFYTRMLYSCLVDADFLDTESFMQNRERSPLHADFDALNDRLDAYVSKWWDTDKELNIKRCAILRNCMEKGTLPKGLFSLTVPTGGGKTVASLAFALRHARENHMARVIYVIPYTSIIEQNAQVFRSILGDDQVLEHHSNVEYDIQEEADADVMRKVQATENWDAPVVVTTAVQFFESLFAAKSSRCRKLHNIANSVIIFDEAQMMPIPFLRPCVHAIAQLVANYGATAVLCTATQPALNPMFREFLPGRQITELCPEQLFQDAIFKRVLFRRQKDTLTCAEIADVLMQHHQVLCIVNSRAAAQEVFESMEGDGCYHLSTMMCPAHRKSTLAEIRQRLKENSPCRVISTSLIEAGVDVDFPLVYRESTGLDSILQAAGRCNREGKRPLEESICTVFRRKGNLPPLFMAQVAAGNVAMDAYADNIAGKAAVTRYFEELFDLRGQARLDEKQILKRLRGDNFPFRTVAKLFKLIEDEDTRTIYLPFAEAAPYLARLRNGERNRELLRKLGQYSVSVYQQTYMDLLMAGVLEELDEQVAILTDMDIYDQQTGLAVKQQKTNAIYV